jgi:hypothetical protein
VVIIDVIISIRDLEAIWISEHELLGHPLFLSKLSNTDYGIVWHREFGPTVTENSATTAEGHKK